MMDKLHSLFLSLERIRIAKVIANSLPLTASLSAIHLIGFTLLMGGAVVSNLRLTGALLASQPLTAVRRPAERGMLVGLFISVTTGFLLFAPRASTASENTFFQLKMTALVAAFVCQFVLQRIIMSKASDSSAAAKAIGATALTLWLGLAIAACAFVLLE
jgi:hypothetical protein